MALMNSISIAFALAHYISSRCCTRPTTAFASVYFMLAVCSLAQLLTNLAAHNQHEAMYKALRNVCIRHVIIADEVADLVTPRLAVDEGTLIRISKLGIKRIMNILQDGQRRWRHLRRHSPAFVITTHLSNPFSSDSVMASMGCWQWMIQQCLLQNAALVV